VFGKKFFVSKTIFHGFNVGGGKFRVFSFSEPPNQEDAKIDMEKLEEE